ncbi:MAG: YbaB/EbfC family nucleoid-associated protein, partial [Candidatus Dormibacteraeota bacterium]|nr:YbaB/EbfC family nucleoid-associated protein [Candidatus Dormibacteraeota bacterium]
LPSALRMVDNPQGGNGLPQFNPKQLRQLQQTMARQFEQTQSDLANREVEGSAGGGAVTVRCNGQQRVLGVAIDQAVLEEGSEMVSDLVQAAVNDALDRSRELAARSMEAILPPGMLPPGVL